MQSFPYASNYELDKDELKTKYIFLLIDFNFEAFYRKMKKYGLGSLYL